MKIVVTGVAGLLGSHMAERYLEEGHEVVGVDDFIGGYPENVPAGVEFYELHLQDDLEQLTNIFAGADIVVHAACTAHEGLSVFSPNFIVDNTVQATVVTLSAAIRAGASKFIYLSSMARYGDLGGKVLEESDTPKPQDPYGIAKLASEQLVRNLCDVHGLDWVVIVPHNIIGSRQKFDDPFRSAASIMTNRILQGKQPIIYGDGKQTRCFSFIGDVVDSLYEATFRPEAIGQVINVGPDEEPVELNTLAYELLDILGSDLEPIWVADRPQEVKHAVCSADKARRLLGYETTTSFRAGLTELVNYIMEHGPRPFDYSYPIEIQSNLTPKTWADRLM